MNCKLGSYERRCLVYSFPAATRFGVHSAHVEHRLLSSSSHEKQCVAPREQGKPLGPTACRLEFSALPRSCFLGPMLLLALLVNGGCGREEEGRKEMVVAGWGFRQTTWLKFQKTEFFLKVVLREEISGQDHGVS